MESPDWASLSDDELLEKKISQLGLKLEGTKFQPLVDQFYDELAQTFHAPGDFAQAYVLAHEIGHHVQKLLGISDKVSAMRDRPDYNEYSVRLELQADCYAGVWANHSKKYLERGDIEEAMRAANAIGDDAIQRKMRGRVVPHSFTHGTSAQRMRWFNRGFQGGRIEDGDTFSIPYSSL